MRSLTIQQNDSGQRLDRFLSKTVSRLPQALANKYIRIKRIKVNKQRTNNAYRLCPGDVVDLYISEEFFGGDSKEHAFLQLKNNIRVVYEDENILLADKPSGQLCHSDDQESFHTLIEHVKAYLYERGEYDPLAEQSFAPALCNRIDRNTGGIVIAAKNASALREMNEKIKTGQVSKQYLLLADGHLEHKWGKLVHYIEKNEQQNRVYLSERSTPGSKRAETLYQVLDERDGISLIEARLVTGRTHQIRAQFAHIGHPLVGDGKYGLNSRNKQLGRKTQALYSYKIAFEFVDTLGCLSYLAHKEFTVPQVDFVTQFGFDMPRR